MASIRKELLLEASAQNVWAAIRDFGAVHKRVAPGFALECTLEKDTRIVTFANGAVAHESLVDLDDDQRRLVYAIRSERVSHYNASLQVLYKDERHTRLIWTVDVLPNELKGYIDQQMEQAVRVMKPTLEDSQALPVNTERRHPNGPD